jgi:hypothetical protein
MAFTDAVDSIYQYVKARILVVNPQRQVKGFLTAQDWPPKNVTLDAFYLLVLGEVAAGRTYYSASTPVKFHQLQWVWINQGTDLTPGIRQANRGTKYRTMQQMKGELQSGLFPNFCEKFSWSLDGNGNWVSAQLIPQQWLLWAPVEFHEKIDKESGIMYGSGAIRVVDQMDEITA